MPGKLFVYDTADPHNVNQARGRFSGVSGVTEIATDTVDGLLTGLDDLVRRRATFDRLLVQTHGGPGVIKFGTRRVFDTTWRDKERFSGRGYEKLFPTYTRVYFDGCNVAEGDSGTQFLIAAGQVFTRLGGGEVFAFPDAGYGFPGTLPFIGGHTIHLTGRLKTAYFLAGGILHSVQESRSAAERAVAGVHLAFRR
jgi:hypothetical protein